MNSTSVSTSFATERLTSSGSAFQRGGADALGEALDLGADRLELLHLDPRNGLRGRFRLAWCSRLPPGAARFPDHQNSSGANANTGHGPVTVTAYGVSKVCKTEARRRYREIRRLATR